MPHFAVRLSTNNSQANNVLYDVSYHKIYFNFLDHWEVIVLRANVQSWEVLKEYKRFKAFNHKIDVKTTALNEELNWSKSTLHLLIPKVIFKISC